MHVYVATPIPCQAALFQTPPDEDFAGRLTESCRLDNSTILLALVTILT